jgi:hypothetical protein
MYHKVLAAVLYNRFPKPTRKFIRSYKPEGKNKKASERDHRHYEMFLDEKPKYNGILLNE